MNEANKKILRYLFLPQIMPRVKDLLSSGFGYAAFYMAMIYRAAQLLPATHPYLRTANIGRFGIRHVIAEAASNLQWQRKNTDQIMIFGLLLVGMVLLALQLGALVLAMFMQTAHATLPANYGEFFVTQAPANDIAFVLLDRVFGLPGMFDSCVTTNQPCYNNLQPDGPYPFHNALRTILQFYSIGLLVVAALILAYFIMAVVVETAQTGTPFGKRFNHAWVPVRLVVAMGLLIPLGSGLNSAQYIVLYAAKWGSGFATNGWNLFIDRAVTAEETLLGNRERLIARPSPPPVNELAPFFSTVTACLRGQRSINNRTEINAYIMNPHSTDAAPPTLIGADYEDIRDNYYGGSTAGPNARRRNESTKILIYFGEYGVSQRTSGAGNPGTGGGQIFPSRIQNTEPTCGAISLEIPDIDTEGSAGSQFITGQYFCLLQTLAGAALEASGGEGGDGNCEASPGNLAETAANIGNSSWLRLSPIESERMAAADMPDIDTMRETITGYSQFLDNVIENGINLQRESDHWTFDLRQLGWGGAGIWYNRVAQLNGALIGAAYNLPLIVQYPKQMEDVQQSRSRITQAMQGVDRFRPYQPGGDRPIEALSPQDFRVALAGYNALVWWEDVSPTSTGNIFTDMVKSIFGLDGLFDMYENTDIHPMAQLVAVGKSIVNRAIINLGNSFAGFAVSSAATALDVGFASTAAAAYGSFMSTIAMLGLGIGFVLFYVVPFLPFIYFFFAVGGWVKSIFEAMVGVPLWALAHLRIDGNGLPGDAAMGGYYLILEIFLRPILIIFGLLGSITIFAAQVKVLHEIWHLVVTNVGGLDQEAAQSVETGLTGAIEWLRNPVDQFFYTIMYAIIVYMLAMSSFKLIDMIPNHILRWLGSSAQTFGDTSGEEAGNVMRNALLSSNFVAGGLRGAGQGMQQMANSGAEGVRGLIRGGG